jgi:lysophospholipase L1-like esterase
MVTRTRALLSSLAGVTLVASGLLGASAASAAPREPFVYDALGDSYASGVGAPPYDPASGACARSASAYPEQLDGRMRIALDDFAACAGATTQTLVSGGQLAALDEDTDLVTLMIGGNDIFWGQAVQACLGGTDLQCAGALGIATDAVTTLLPGRLDGLYAQVSDLAPNAHVVVVGYPRLFSPEFGSYLGASTAEQQALNDGADLLGGVIADRAAAHGFQYVDVTERFDGHGVNADEPWILGPGPGSFHPNPAGYQAYTAALTSQIVPSRLP